VTIVVEAGATGYSIRSTSDGAFVNTRGANPEQSCESTSGAHAREQSLWMLDSAKEGRYDLR
jgi:hypothetical protein